MAASTARCALHGGCKSRATVVPAYVRRGVAAHAQRGGQLGTRHAGMNRCRCRVRTGHQQCERDGGVLQQVDDRRVVAHGRRNQFVEVRLGGAPKLGEVAA